MTFGAEAGDRVVAFGGDVTIAFIDDRGLIFVAFARKRGRDEDIAVVGSAAQLNPLMTGRSPTRKRRVNTGLLRLGLTVKIATQATPWFTPSDSPHDGLSAKSHSHSRRRRALAQTPRNDSRMIMTCPLVVAFLEDPMNIDPFMLLCFLASSLHAEEDSAFFHHRERRPGLP